ncbi:Hypothetical predicted protein [Xyrichtys novacula]|uniref:Uncharacterized protein n=1 Tax=Xyrichtys novacula TaxID=13765 RepID=A0AAV1FLA6_XYRNO|nr:Hypothetical predicted protein [Xyrichtys novacula]
MAETVAEDKVPDAAVEHCGFVQSPSCPNYVAAEVILRLHTEDRGSPKARLTEVSYYFMQTMWSSWTCEPYECYCAFHESSCLHTKNFSQDPTEEHNPEALQDTLTCWKVSLTGPMATITR